uniref:Protein kinase domain-containing protein n=1 Tax=Petromyzon marinus TaxID=7757 RepID=S4RVK3_PETMA
YERLASLLLLHLCAALEHLKMHGVTHCGLRLENLLLAHSGRPGDPTPRLVLSNFLQAKQQQQPKNRAHHDQVRLAPELLSAAQYRKLDEFQTGILIYEMLHLPNPFEDDPGLRASGYSTDDLPPFLRLSCYSTGLQRLAFQLLQPDPASRLPIAEARVALQLLAWGPQAEHLTRELGGPRPDGRRLQEVLRNWLDVRRALLMVVFAEKALAQDGPEGGGVNLEDWLRCQFFAFATVNCMARAVELLRL